MIERSSSCYKESPNSIIARMAIKKEELQMKENVVLNGLNIKNLMDSIEKMLAEGLVSNNTVVTIDTFDGYRHGIEKLVVEGREVLTISAKIHGEC